MGNKQQEIEDAWLGITVDESQLFNPMDFVMADGDNDRLIERIAWLMMRPEYFSFVAKYVLNIELSPFQCLMLQEMWNKKFPMLIGSRGLGKALTPDTPVLTPSGWVNIENLNIGDKVIGGDGRSTRITNKTGLQESLNFYRVTLNDGRTIDCCEDHMWKVWDNVRDDGWKELNTKELSKKYYRDVRNKKSEIPKKVKQYRYSLPVNSPVEEFPERDLPVHPYLVGVLIGDGQITQHECFVRVKGRCLERLRELISDEYDFTHKDYHPFLAVAPKDKNSLNVYRRLKSIGVTILEGEIPDIYLHASREQRLFLLQGILDSKGIINDSNIEHDTAHYSMHCSMLDLIRSLGFSCSSYTVDNNLYHRRRFDHYKIFIYGTKGASNLIEDENARDHPDKVTITKIEKIGKQNGMCIAVDNADKTYITKDYIVTHNSFLLSVYSVLRALFMPRRKIIIVGAAFRQSKVIFEYMDTIWKNAPILRDLSSNNSGPKRDVDRCVMHINDSTITALPLGDGQKIRGQRANDIIADEFACLRANTLIQTDYGLIEIADYLNGEAYSLMNKDAQFEYPETIFRTPKTDVYRITTQYGYFFECSDKHQVMTQDGWKIAKDLIPNKDRLEIDYNDYFPENWTVDKDTAWLMGLIVSEGNCTNRNFFTITNTDKALIEKIQKEIKIDWSLSHRPSYVDKRGWNCKASYILKYNNTSYRERLRDYGLDFDISINKKFPKGILTSTKQSVLAFLSGIYEGDGSAFFTNSKGRDEFQVVLYSSSEQLLLTTQKVLLKFGVLSSLNGRDVGTNNINYRLVTRGDMASKLFGILDVLKWKNIKAPKLTEKRLPQIKKISESKYRVATTHGNRNHYLGTFSSREDCIKRFEDFYKDKRELVIVKSVEKLEKQEVLYDFYMPKTNSFIGNGFVQHNSIPRDIFENVVAGFAAVSASPIDKVKHKARIKKAKELGISLKDDTDEPMEKSNQIILSGTAYYYFNHFADYWKRYKSIINSKGNINALKEIFGEEPSPEFDWREYSVIRMPVDKLPEGFMDEGQIARAKATIHSGIYNMEYSACFTTDSQGFFKRSLLEACTASMDNSIILPSGEVHFGAMLKGDPKKKYIFGVDPASEVDNFSIVIIELNEDHRRIVYSWTTTRQQHKAKLKSRLVDEDDFYAYCSKKIRSLMRVFPCIEIALDTQGGGIAIIEALQDKDKMQSDEVAIWPTVDENKEKDTDDNPGLHILKLCQFAKADWLAEANHGLRKDFEDKVLLFPFFDSASIGVSIEEDKAANRVYDTLEDCVMEIEELKDELSMIVMTQTSNGRERWDTPEIKVAAGRKSRLRKDRYSSLLMANMSARVLAVEKHSIEYGTIGGFAETSSKAKFDNSKLYNGPNWFTDKIQNVY